MYWVLSFRDVSGEKFSFKLDDKKRTKDEVYEWRKNSHYCGMIFSGLDSYE